MSLIHADNFNIYGTDVNLMLNGRYSEITGCTIQTDPDGVSVPKVLRMRGSFAGTTQLRRPLAVPTGKVGIGFRLWLASLPSDNDMRPEIAYWRNATNQAMVSVYVNTTGSMSVYVRDATSGLITLIGTTTGPVVTANAWWHVECMFDAATLDFEIRVEGVTKLTLDAADFGANNPGNTVYQCGLAGTQNSIGATIFAYFKDYVWWDGLGSQNNDFLGSCLVSQIDPISDVDIGGWVPSTGTEAWSILDTTTPGDTPYIAAAIPPVDPVIMEQSNLPPDITSVKGIMTVVRAAKVDGGDGNLQVSLISNAVEGNGVDRPITAAMTYWEDTFELDPDTAAPWTPTAVDAAQIQLERTV
jgi:hypothetical protein